MTRRDVSDWLREHWLPLVIAVLAVGGWAARVEAAIRQMDELVPDHEVVQGLGRLECIRSRINAASAGLPCGKLLGDR